MQFARYLRPEQVCCQLTPQPLRSPEEMVRLSPQRQSWLRKEAVVRELATLFNASESIVNPNKFLTDLINREKKASTALGEGLAVPHVRSLQPRRLLCVVARSTQGVEYDSPDGKPVYLFFGLVAPSYNDREYLKFYRWIALSFREEEWLMPSLMEAADEHEIIKILRSLP